jgi:hypothetical protein
MSELPHARQESDSFPSCVSDCRLGLRMAMLPDIDHEKLPNSRYEKVAIIAVSHSRRDMLWTNRQKAQMHLPRRPRLPGPIR